MNSFRIGQGYDVHRLVSGRPLIIGGVKIPYEYGLDGHSDADVLIHALADALLGACAMRDIGYHFPDNDNKYLNISSISILKTVMEMLKKAGYKVVNADMTVIAQNPKLSPYIDSMRKNISDELDIDISYVSVKATTEERLGFTGAGEGIAAQAVVMITIVK